MTPKQREKLAAKLDGRQRAAALACVEREFSPEAERRGFEDIAKEAGVTRNTLYEWRTQNRAFIEYMNAIADDYLSGKRAIVYKRLMQLIDSGQPSVKAIDLFMKREGLITAKAEIDVTGGSAAPKSNEELAAELAELDDILADVDGTDGVDS